MFEPVEYVLTAFMASEYAHGVEENWEGLHSSRAPCGRQMRPPTMIHVDKMRILERTSAGRLVTTDTDKTLLKYEPEEKA